MQPPLTLTLPLPLLPLCALQLRLQLPRFYMINGSLFPGLIERE